MRNGSRESSVASREASSRKSEPSMGRARRPPELLWGRASRPSERPGRPLPQAIPEPRVAFSSVET